MSINNDCSKYERRRNAQASSSAARRIKLIDAAILTKTYLGIILDTLVQQSPSEIVVLQKNRASPRVPRQHSSELPFSALPYPDVGIGKTLPSHGSPEREEGCTEHACT